MPISAGKPDAGLNLIRKQTIEAHLSFLASDALEGREAGRRGGRVAAEYIQAVLKDLDVKPLGDSFLQPFEAYSPARDYGVDFHVNRDSIEQYKRQTHYRKLDLQNVIGYVEGERKEEYIVIGAHYDHLGVDDLLVGDKIYNGADDNAASVAALLQIAKAFSGEKKPLRSLIFAFWDGEEVNYLGSEYFVDNFANTSAIKSYINLDMIGREGLMPVLFPEFIIPEASSENTAGGNQFHLLYTEELNDETIRIIHNIQNNKLNIEAKPNVIAHQSRGSDYLAFSLRRIPILWFFTGLHPEYHTPADETATVDLDKITEITKATYLTIKQLSEWK
ncbi:MAG: M28 family peptidase [Tannerellaceae bacterium]|nr:M28 family peptidase [Tannerellaceae bacterium]